MRVTSHRTPARAEGLLVTVVSVRHVVTGPLLDRLSEAARLIGIVRIAAVRSASRLSDSLEHLLREVVRRRPVERVRGMARARSIDSKMYSDIVRPGVVDLESVPRRSLLPTLNTSDPTIFSPLFAASGSGSSRRACLRREQGYSDDPPDSLPMRPRRRWAGGQPHVQPRFGRLRRGWWIQPRIDRSSRARHPGPLILHRHHVVVPCVDRLVRVVDALG